MRCNHPGILLFLKKKRIKISEDDFIVFMNSSRNMIKMLCKGEQAVLHYRAGTRILDPGIIAYLPKYVDGQIMNVDGAIREDLEKRLARAQKRRN